MPHPLLRRLAVVLALVAAAAFAETPRHHAARPPDPSKVPVANNDSFSVRQGGVLVLSAAQGVLANDANPLKKPLTAVLISATQHGALFLNADGSFAYAHDGSGDPSDSFLYYATDGTADSNPARATIAVTPDHAPVAINDSYATGPATPLTVAAPGVLANDSDADNDVLTARLVAAPAHGTLALNADGSFIYTPDGSKSPDSFTYVASDGVLDSAVTTVSIAVDTSVHANADTYPATENTPRVVDPPGVLGNDLLNGAKITGYGAATGTEQSQIGAVTPTAGGGSVALNADGSFRFTPGPYFTGADTFRYTLANSDGKASSVVMMMVFAPPVANADAYDVAGGAAASQAAPGVLANDTVNGAAISGYGAASGTEQRVPGSATPTSAGGSVTLRADGSFTYAPPANFNGADSFKYTLSNFAGSAPATVTLRVSSAPSAVADNYQAAANAPRNVGAASGVLANDTVNGAAIRSYGASGSEQASIGSPATTAQGGTVALSADGSFSYTPPPGFSGVDAFKYVLANAGGSAAATVSITILQPPAAANDSYQTAPNATRNVSAALGLLANDTPNSAAISAYGANASSQAAKIGQAAQTGRGGTVVVNADGSFSYTPAANFTGNDAFAYTLTNFAGSSVGTVSISVSATPSAANDTYKAVRNTVLNVPASAGVLVNDAVNGAPIVSFGASTGGEQTAIGAPASTAAGNTVALQADGSFTFTPAASFTGNDSFKYKIANAAGSSTATVSLSVTAGPLAVNDSYAVAKNASFTSAAPGVLANDTPNGGAIAGYGPSSGTEQVTLGSFAPTAQGGTIALNADGSFNYTAPAGFVGTDTFRYALANYAGTSTATVTFTVTQAPVASSDNYVAMTTGPMTVAAPGVLGNDTANGGAIASFGVNGGEQTALGSAAPTSQGGTVALRADGSFTYTPPASVSLSQPLTDTFRYVLTNANGSSTATVTIVVSLNCPAIVISPTSVPAAVPGVAYGPVTFAQSGGAGAITWTIASGALPAGLTLSAAGALSGTATTSGTFVFTVKATDANGCSATAAITLAVRCPLISIVPSTTSGPSVLPSGVTGTAYSAITFTQSGGTAPVAWSLASGSLPNGLILSSAGVLSGTPAQSGTFPFSVRVTDANGCTGALALSLAVVAKCPAIAITPTSVPSGAAGQPYAALSFSQSGGVAPVTWSSGALPPGMTFSSAGVLAGTPTAVGVYNFAVTATDANGCSATLSLPLGIGVTCPAITIAPVSLASAVAGVAYSAVTLSATGGVAPLAWSLASGMLPAGMSLSSAGVISGTPSAAGPFAFTVKATDANGCFGTLALSLTVNAKCPPITINPPALVTATAGAPYSAVSFTQSGGAAPITWTAGALPAGMSLSADGTLSGTPTVVGAFNITVTATDANGCTATMVRTFTIVCPTITIAPTTLPTGKAGTAYSSVTFSTSAGVAPITWTIASGLLPGGMTLSTAGVLSGTPASNGTFTFSVKATDADGCSAAQSLTLVVNAKCDPITITAPAALSSTSATAGVPYAAVSFSASGGAAPYTWSCTAVPPGMQFSTAGVFFGTPENIGTFNLTVIATDANGCTGTLTTTFKVVCPGVTVIPSSATPYALPNGSTGTAYSFTFSLAGGVAPVSWSITSGTLPAGITLSNGALSGTPTVPGSANFTITGTDADGCSDTQDYSLKVVVPCPAITVTAPSPMPGATAGVTYSSVTFTQSGAALPVTWSIDPLPSGMTFKSGVLAGTPTVTGTFSLSVMVKDANGCTGTTTVTLTIGCATMEISPSTLSSGTVGNPYGPVVLSASPSVGTVNFTVSGLPTGLSFDNPTATISGTPGQFGAFSVTATATDANGCTTSTLYLISFDCANFSITSPDPTTVTVGDTLSEQFTAPGAFGTVTFSTDASKLPRGVTLSTSGLLSGTPKDAGNYDIVVFAKDSAGCSTSVTYKLTVTCQVLAVFPPVVVCSIN